MIGNDCVKYVGMRGLELEIPLERKLQEKTKMNSRNHNCRTECCSQKVNLDWSYTNVFIAFFRRSFNVLVYLSMQYKQTLPDHQTSDFCIIFCFSSTPTRYSFIFSLLLKTRFCTTSLVNTFEPICFA